MKQTGSNWTCEVERLRERTGLPIEVVELRDALRHPLLLAEILRDGRVLADRDGQWAQLQTKGKTIRAEAEQERRRLTERSRPARRAPVRSIAIGTLLVAAARQC